MTSTGDLMNFVTSSNENLSSTYDYLYDSSETQQPTMNASRGSQHLATMLQQFFAKMLNNQTTFQSDFNFPLADSSASSVFPYETFVPTSVRNTNSYHLFTTMSLWFVLIVNPIVILLGVTGNLLATYILIRFNIAKLPVSFYTIMLNISDTLNLLIPVLIFWLDNCINRSFEQGYFRDRSNFLCKALMCPDQLFAALSAWYMCAISFNRWYSVCRPSSYFFRFVATMGKSSVPTDSNNNDTRRSKTKFAILSNQTSFFSFIPFCFPWTYLKQNIKFHQHVQAFRSIACITLLGFLCCLYPIFMHELRPVAFRNEHKFDLKRKMTKTFPVVVQRCNYSQKHQYAYDIIGIILSCFLHILPLTFVALMNVMIIVRLQQRQKLMTVSTSLLPSSILPQKKRKSSSTLLKRLSSGMDFALLEQRPSIRHSQPSLSTTRKDQATLTDFSLQTPHPPAQQVLLPAVTSPAKRHHSRDRTITIMLVSVALSYLILTLPYRLFWSYNVYIRRIHPEKLKSSIYLLKMHYIDHILRTIRNIHYGTNFVFFIFLSKTFRRKFRQIFLEKFLQATYRVFHRASSTTETSQDVVSFRNNHRHHHRRRRRSKQRIPEIKTGNALIDVDYLSRSLFDETPSLNPDVRLREDEITPIFELERHHLSRSNGKSK